MEPECGEIEDLYTPLDDSLSLNLNLLCWGLWQANVSLKDCEINIKPSLMDQKMGHEWFCEPYTKTISHYETMKYKVEGCFRYILSSYIKHWSLISRFLT